MNTVRLRAWNKETREMYLSSKENFLISSGGFVVFVEEDAVADDTSCVLMRGCNFKDKNGVDIYEGDLVYFKRRTVRGFLPVIGIVSQKDFTFHVASDGMTFFFDYSDKELEILGNVFQNTDAELAERAENKLKHFTAKQDKK